MPRLRSCWLNVRPQWITIIVDIMARLDVAITRRTDPATKRPIALQYVLGRFGAVLAIIAAAVLAVVIALAALVLGYFIAGFVIAAMLVAIFIALLSSAFRGLRR
jgi:hypothetical protein